MNSISNSISNSICNSIGYALQKQKAPKKRMKMRSMKSKQIMN